MITSCHINFISILPSRQFRSTVYSVSLDFLFLFFLNINEFWVTKMFWVTLLTWFPGFQASQQLIFLEVRMVLFSSVISHPTSSHLPRLPIAFKCLSNPCATISFYMLALSEYPVIVFRDVICFVYSFFLSLHFGIDIWNPNNMAGFVKF
jgi:hypothetical protein